MEDDLPPREGVGGEIEHAEPPPRGAMAGRAQSEARARTCFPAAMCFTNTVWELFVSEEARRANAAVIERGRGG